MRDHDPTEIGSASIQTDRRVINSRGRERAEKIRSYVWSYGGFVPPIFSSWDVFRSRYERGAATVNDVWQMRGEVEAIENYRRRKAFLQKWSGR